ncbi:MAG: hypothetical protein KA419_10330 [Acidobacteria bacterium]|nr:hypothetical protein [Acidobacteriota bacterium]
MRTDRSASASCKVQKGVPRPSAAWWAAIRLAALAGALAAGAAALRAGPPADPSWPPAVKAAFGNATALPAAPPDPVVAAVRKLGGLGIVARPAMARLAGDPSLPVPHRAMSGILLARYSAFDAAALRQFLASESPYLCLEAAQLLGRLGGDDNRSAVSQAAVKRPGQATQLNKFVAAWPPAPPIPAPALKLLDAVLREPDERVRLKAITALTVDYGAKVRDSLEWTLACGVTSESTQMDLAAAVVRICTESGASLEPLCRKGRQKFLRLLAIQELAKRGAAEKAFLRQLAADPAEPLREHIEKALQGK